MFPYTHYALAYKLAKQIEPERLDEYLWGAIAPDVRYLAGMRRHQTHLPRGTIQGWFTTYPQLESFILGYQVHCLLDEIDLSLVIGRAFPLNLVRLARGKDFTQQQMAAVVELSYLQDPQAPKPVSGAHNPILAELGVRPEHCAAYSSALHDYLASPSLQKGFLALEQAGLAADARAALYLRAAEELDRRWLVKGMLLTAVKNARIEHKALKYVEQNLR